MLSGMAAAMSRLRTQATLWSRVTAARAVPLFIICLSLSGMPAQAQEGGRAVRPDNQDNWEAIQELALTGRPCSLIGSLGLDENAEAVLAAFREMERSGEVRFDGDRAFFAGRAEMMMLDMRDYEVAGILLATVVYRDCVSRRLSAPNFRLDAEAAGRIVFRQDAQGWIRSFRRGPATIDRCHAGVQRTIHIGHPLHGPAARVAARRVTVAHISRIE